MGFLLYSFYGYAVATLGALAIFIFESPVFKVAGLLLPFVFMCSSWLSYYILQRQQHAIPGGQAYKMLPTEVSPE